VNALVWPHSAIRFRPAGGTYWEKENDMSTQEISVLVKQLVKTARRRRRPPSKRNLEIHRAVRVDGEGQADVAILNGLSQSRVSAICRQVDRWRAEEEAVDWQRLQREQRTELNLPGKAGSDTMVGSARAAAPAA